MTDNELKFKVLEMAMDVARDNAFARRQTLENKLQHSQLTPAQYPDLPEIEVDTAVLIYVRLMEAISKR
jgi:hypothetical protein